MVHALSIFFECHSWDSVTWNIHFVSTTCDSASKYPTSLGTYHTSKKKHIFTPQALELDCQRVTVMHVPAGHRFPDATGGGVCANGLGPPSLLAAIFSSCFLFPFFFYGFIGFLFLSFHVLP